MKVMCDYVFCVARRERGGEEGEGRGGGTDDLDTIGSRWVRRPAS